MSSHAGKFLIARPILQDPSFRRTVVLVLQHGDQGAFGLVINRPASVKGLPFPLFTGGPCKSEGMLMLHGHVEWSKEVPAGEKAEVAPGIFLGDAACFSRASEEEESANLRVRMYTGYSGWGPGQLEAELATGAWAIVPATGEVLFDTPVLDLWDSLVPPAIPQPSVN